MLTHLTMPHEHNPPPVSFSITTVILTTVILTTVILWPFSLLMQGLASGSTQQPSPSLPILGIFPFQPALSHVLFPHLVPCHPQPSPSSLTFLTFTKFLHGFNIFSRMVLETSGGGETTLTCSFCYARVRLHTVMVSVMPDDFTH